MIVKKVPTSKRAAPQSKGHNVRALADYIAGPKAGGDGEKVEHRGALNLLNLDHEGQVQEMIDLAETARRSPQPVQHWILSWREGEQPTPAQVDRAVATFLDEMGLADHQAIYALHRDTRNCHLHLAVNRVHPDTEEVITVNNGFDHEVAHRAIARIERDQGWQREDRALFLSRPDGELERSRPRGERERQPSGPARDFEERVGERSAQRIALEIAAPIIREARTWREIHEGLAREGIRFERKGSGAVLWIGHEPVKASNAGRDCSLSALEKRLGELTVQRSVREVPARAPQPLERMSSRWAVYAQERARHHEERAETRARVRDRQSDEWRRMVDRQRGERADVLSGSWRGREDLLNATRSQLAARQAQEKAELRDQQKLERARLQRERERFPDFKEWLAERSPDLAQQWRYRERQPPTLEGPTFELPAPHDIRSFEPVVDGGLVHYRLAGERGSPSFTDRGKVIDIRDGNRETVLAALQLSAQKWGTFTVHGDEQFRRVCVELAREHGFKIENPELQREIAAGRESLRVERAHQSVQRPEVRSIGDAYRLHFADATRDGDAALTDPSRVDAEVAVRLRLTGHPPSAIERAIREGAQAMRSAEPRDWGEYARRAVEFAFDVPGSRMVRALAHRHEHLLSLEDRHIGREIGSRGRDPELGR